MTNLQDQQVQELLEQPNHAVVSTFNKDGSILSTVAWVNTEGDALAVNSAVGRRWPAKGPPGLIWPSSGSVRGQHR